MGKELNDNDYRVILNGLRETKAKLMERSLNASSKHLEKIHSHTEKEIKDVNETYLKVISLRNKKKHLKI